MSFSQEMEDFVSAFSKTYRAPRQKSESELQDDEALRTGRAAAESQPQRTARSDPSWARSTSAVPVNGSAPRLPSMAGAGPIGDYARAIQATESSGNYGALGPVVKRGSYAGQRALGAYQVMPGNVGPWAREAGLGDVTPDQFLADPSLQDRVFQDRFGKLVEKYGNPRDAASVWFTGVPYEQAVREGRADQNIPIEEYVRRFERGLPRPAMTLSMRKGGTVGAVPLYQEGGSVGPSDDDEDDRYVTSSKPGWSIGDIADAAMNFASETFGLGQGAVPGASPRAEAGAKAFSMNIGAATPDQMKRIEDTVDPDKEMSTEQRRIAMYKGMYDFYMDRNEPRKAAQAVFSMGMAAKRAAQLYGGVALKALEANRPDVAAEALKKGYDELPDGRSMNVKSAGPDGVTFEVTDADGNVTDRGKFAIDEMVRVATGMTDGSAFLQHWGQIRQRTEPKPDRTAVRQEQERAAIEEFSSSLNKDQLDDFVAGLSEDQRAKFLRMPRAAQNDFIRRYTEDKKQTQAQENIEYNQAYKELQDLQRQENRDLDREIGVEKHLQSLEAREAAEAARSKRFETRMNNQTNQFEIRRQDGLNRWVTARDDRLEREAQRMRKEAFELALKQKNWESERERLMSNFERTLAQRQREEENRNIRADESEEARRERYAQIDKRIMENREIQERRRAQAASERAVRELVPKTERERKVKAVEEQLGGEIATREAEIAAEPGTVDIEGQGAVPVYGPTVRQQERLQEEVGPLRAERTFQLQETARRNAPPRIDDVEVEDAVRKVYEEAQAARDQSRGWFEKGMPDLTPVRRDLLSSAAKGIAAANPNITVGQAAQIALAAGANDTAIRFQQIGPDRTLVVIGDTRRPIVLGREALTAIAMLRGGTLNKPTQFQTQNDGAAPAAPGASGNPGVATPRTEAERRTGGIRQLTSPTQDAREQAEALRREQEARAARRVMVVDPAVAAAQRAAQAQSLGITPQAVPLDLLPR